MQERERHAHDLLLAITWWYNFLKHGEQRERIMIIRTRRNYFFFRQTSRDQSYVEWVIVSFTWYHTQAWVHVSDQREFLPWWSFFPFFYPYSLVPSSKYDLRFYSKNFKTERIPESFFAVAPALLIIITWRGKKRREVKPDQDVRQDDTQRERRQEQAVRRRATIKW